MYILKNYYSVAGWLLYWFGFIVMGYNNQNKYFLKYIINMIYLYMTRKIIKGMGSV